MSESHAIEGMMGVTMEKIREMVEVDTIIGKPISTQDGTTIIPVSKVSFGFVSGGSDLPAQTAERFAGGSGAGVTVKPQAFIVIKNDGNVEMLEIGGKSSGPFDTVIDAVPDIIAKIKEFFPPKDDAKSDKSKKAEK